MERPDDGGVPLPGQQEPDRGSGGAAVQLGGAIVLVGEGGASWSGRTCGVSTSQSHPISSLTHQDQHSLPQSQKGINEALR